MSVTTRMILFASLAAALVLAILVAAFRALRAGRRDAKTSWESLLDRLQTVNGDNMALVAQDLEHPSETDDDFLSDSQIWDLVGGLEGLEKLESNCDVLVDLAAYVQRWYPEALITAEELRLNAREIKWHVSRLQGAEKNGNLRITFSSYAPRAVATYCHMTKSLLELYEMTKLPQTATLRAAL